MKGLILVNAYSTQSEMLYQPNRLKEEFNALGVDCDVVRNDFFPFCIDKTTIKSKLIGYDFCVYLDKDKYSLKCIDEIGIPLFNGYDAIETCDDKMLTYIRLARHSIPTPKTLPGLLCYDADAPVKDDSVNEIERQLGYPVIIKECYGSLGKGVYLARERNKLVSVMEKVKCTPHLFQSFIETSYGRDLRVIVIGDTVVGGMLRQSNGDFRSNITAGGNGSPYPLTDEIKSLALRCAQAIGLDYCGIDLLFDGDDFVVCEVNSNAFFGGFEKVTGINVARIYAKYIIEKLS